MCGCGGNFPLEKGIYCGSQSYVPLTRIDLKNILKSQEISSRWAARDKGGRHLDDPDSIVDSMKTLSLLHEPLTNTARASTTLASERGKRVDSYSGDKENADDGLIDLT